MSDLRAAVNSVKPLNPFSTFARILRELGSYKWHLVALVFAGVISVAANVGGAYYLKEVLSAIENAGNAPGETLLAELGSGVMFMIFIYLTGVVGTFVSMRLILTISTGVLYNFRVKMFTHMEKLPIKYFDARTHGEIMSRYTTDTDALREMISNGLPNIVSSILTILGVLTMMIILSPTLTLLVLGMLVVMVIAVSVIGSKGRKYFIGQQAELANANGYIEEHIEGQKVVQVFCREDKIKEGFGAINDALCKAETSAQTYAQILMPVMGNLSYVNYVLTAVAGAFLVATGRLAGGIAVVIVFLHLSRQLSMPLTQISQQFNGIMTALAGAERIFALLDEGEENDDGYVTLVNARKTADGIEECDERTGQWAWKHYHRATDTTTYVEWRGAVEFENVTFGYVEGETVLHNVSFNVQPGQKIALVGSTGAGKTTITNLLNRFYGVTEGKIRFDGININKIKKEDLRRSMAMVLQDTHLFTGSVRDNIRYGRLDATDAEVEEAAKLANAGFFIEHLPEGYETVITADGANLSQGQRQLLAIARAAVAAPPVLVLDEATSSVDTRTEALIEQGMDKLMEGRTVFVIAHRLSTVRNADSIFVIEHGEIIERGNHEELLAAGGRYYMLYNGMFELD